MHLTDQIIRPSLIEFLNSLSIKPKKIVEELHVNYGTAIADIVAVYNTLHCFEIKGESDKISRLINQGKYFDAAFSKITLVTTPNHEIKAIKQIPSHWGMIIVSNQNGGLQFRYSRKAKHNPNFVKEIALYTLWKEELLKITNINEIPVNDKMNKKAISQVISTSLTKWAMEKSISEMILNRTKY